MKGWFFREVWQARQPSRHSSTRNDWPSAQQVITTILVGGVPMVGAQLLLPREPIYASLAMGVGIAAGNLMWRPAGFTLRRHVLAAAFAGVATFAFIWGIQLATGPLY